MADSQGAALARADQQVILGLEQDGKGKCALQTRQHLAHRFTRRFPLGALRRQKMGYHFRIRLRKKDGAGCGQFFLQFAEIFDDSVVHDNHVAGRMGMRVRLRGSAMGGPARVANAGHPHHGRFTQTLFQVAQFARRPAPLDSAILKRCYAR